MAVLRFEAGDVRRIVTHAKTSLTHSMGWGEEDSHAAVFLAGDHGVYLMSNGEPRDKRCDHPRRNFVAYAKGINPETDAGWWEAKRDSYGADDGADTLPIIDQLELLIARGEVEIRLEISDEHVSVLMPDVGWIKPGVMVKSPSGLGGVFTAKVLSVTDTHASVKNSRNAGDFDDAPPYLVPLGKLTSINTTEVV